MRVRKVKLSGGGTGIQVVEGGHDYKIVRHIGSSSDEAEIGRLLELGHQFVRKSEKTIPLFPDFDKKKGNDIVSMSKVDFVELKYSFAYEFLEKYYKLCGFSGLEDKLLKDLAIIRIVEPCSKLRSLILLNKYFDLKYSKNILYKGLLRFNSLKEKSEKIAFEYAKKYLSFDFSLVFFDITTLYFETFKEDKEEFLKPGFSKDGKPQQPQILVSLVVTKEGYPIAMDVFSGNTFEGHTIIPTIEKFKNTHQIENLTVVADAGMLSFDNIQKLVSKNIKYIVGARVGNLPLKLIKELSGYLNKTEGIYFQVETDKGLLICDYSTKRANKNRSDRKKQIQKALNQINSNYKQNKRLRFLKETSKTTSILNQDLIEKDELLEGIKGYYTNLKDQDPKLIVSRYKDLWHVEKAFRIAKSDLLARPIYHFKKESIKAHILIVFLSLCLSKAIELKNNKSIKTVKDIILSVPDITLKDNITNQTFTKKLKNNYNQEFIKQLQY